MLNLFFVIHSYSGVQTYEKELLKYLSTLDEICLHRICIESSEYNEFTIVHNDNIVDVYIPSIKIIPYSTLKYACRSLDLMHPLLDGKSNIIFHLNKAAHILLGVEAKKRFGAKVIFTVHFLPTYFSNLPIKEKPEVSIEIFDVNHLKSIDHIICVTRFAKEIQHKYFNIPSNKIDVIYNGCGCFTGNASGTNQLKKGALKRQFGFSYNDKVILFVGRLEEEKGIMTLIKVINTIVEENCRIRLIIVGDGGYSKILKSTWNCWGHISFTGKISPEQLHKIYHIADIGVIPSISEQCSYVALEMMQHGLPIIISDIHGLKELFEDKNSAILVPLKSSITGRRSIEMSEERLKIELMNLLNNRKLMHKLGTNARQIWRQRFTSEVMGQATINLYKKVLNGQPQGGV